MPAQENRRPGGRSAPPPGLLTSLTPGELTIALRKAGICGKQHLTEIREAFRQASICPRVEVMACINKHWPKTAATVLMEKLQHLLQKMKQQDSKLLDSLTPSELVVALYDETREELRERTVRNTLKDTRKANAKDTVIPPSKAVPSTAPVPATDDEIQPSHNITAINHPMLDMPLVRHSKPREPATASTLGLFSSQQGRLRDHSGAKRQHNLLAATVEAQPQPKKSREVGINSSKKRYEAFKPIETRLATPKNPEFSHDINIVNKKPPPQLISETLSQKYKNIWYMKKAKDVIRKLKNAPPEIKEEVLLPKEIVAPREVVAQEFFRLIIPTHPKTRLVTHHAENETYVLSKQVPGFTPFQKIHPSVINKNIKNKTYKGLGEVLVVSLLMNEIDLKLANIGIDDQNNIIKIDGDWCFTRLIKGWESYNYTISEETISLLPFPYSYQAYNWLDAIIHGKCHTAKDEWCEVCQCEHKCESIDSDISIHPQFRNEVNHAILKILVLPEELIKKFIDTYLIKCENNLIHQEIINRRNNFEAAASKNKSFNDYMKSNAAKNSVDEYIKYLSRFKTTSKNSLEVSNLPAKITHQFDQLILRSAQNPAAQSFPPLPPNSQVYKKSL